MTHSYSQIQLWEMELIFRIINSKLQIKLYLCVRGGGNYRLSKIRFNNFLIWIKYLKSIFNSSSWFKIFRNMWTNTCKEKNGFDQFWIALSIVYKFFRIIWHFLNWIYIKIERKWQEVSLQHFLAIITIISEFFCVAL